MDTTEQTLHEWVNHQAVPVKILATEIYANGAAPHEENINRGIAVNVTRLPKDVVELSRSCKDLEQLTAETLDYLHDCKIKLLEIRDRIDCDFRSHLQGE